MNRQELLNQLIENFQDLYRGILSKRDAQPDGLPFGQRAALFTVAFYGTSHVKQIAKHLHITSGAATQHVEALVQEGLVVRTEDPHDRRNVIITASPNGKKVIKKMERKRLKLMEELFSDITDHELELYNVIMQKVSQKINQGDQD